MPTSAPLAVRAEPLSLTDDRTALLRRGEPSCAWWGPTGGVVGWGVAAAVRGTGWDELWEQWDQLRGRLAGPSDVPVRAVATLTFDPLHSASSCAVIVPELSVVEDGGRRVLIRVGDGAAELPEPTPREAPRTTLPGDGGTAYRAAVNAALDAIATGDVGKVVVATQESVALPPGWSAPTLAERLSSRYPSCWLYLADGLVGASPELLLRLRGEELSSRVLAGTVDRAAPDADAQLADALIAGGKNRREHEYAIESARAALAPICTDVRASTEPFVLELPNVAHLASDLRATVRPGLTLEDLLRALHPTAAVAGTPRERAMAVLHAAEGFDRGRFAGPVGWIDAAGDGEFAIALRGCQLTPDASSLTAYAGAGIVEGSDPEAEWREVQAKLRPVREALAG